MIRTRVRPFLVVTVVGVTMLGGMVFGQSRQQPPKNLKFFPKDIPRSELVSYMRGFSSALGVPCTHCHGTEEQTSSNTGGVDYSLDAKPTKNKAREMLRMMEEINSELLSRISQPSSLNLKVSCFTCHSGIPLPETIESRVLRKIKSESLSAAVEDYRTVRQKYYGSAAYNFGEQPLIETAAMLGREERFQEAAEISLLNLEFHPQSDQSKFQLAEAYVGLKRNEEARKIYLDLLASQPDNRRVRQRLEALDRPQR